MKYKKKLLFKIFKISLQIIIVYSFLFLFYKLFSDIPNRLELKIIFCFVYLWFTIGINVNLVYPVLKFLNRKIE